MMSDFSDWANSGRLAELRRYEILDTAPDSRFDRITRLAADMLETPIAFISFFDERRQWFKSRIGFDFKQAARESSFFEGIGNRAPLLEIEDTHCNERVANNPWVIDEPKVRFFAGAPIASPAGLTLGALCVSDHKPRKLNDRHRDDLAKLSNITTDLLELHKSEIDVRRAKLPLLDPRLRPVLSLVPIFVTILDNAGTLIEANQPALELAGLVLDDVQGKPFWNCEWWTYAPDAQQKLRDAITLASKGETTRWETLIQTKGGSLCTIDCTVAPGFNDKGGVEFVVVSGVDISSRLIVEQHLRESEKRFRGTFDNAAVGMAHVSLDGRWLRFNDVLLETLGYSQEEFLQMTLPQLAHPEDLPGHLKQFGRLKAGEIDHYTREKRYIKKNGQFVWVNVTVSLQRAESGDPLYAILVIEDIATRKAAEMRQRLLVGELSHRVKNIMSMVQSIANQSIGFSGDPVRFVTAFRSRLQAMSRAHDLLTQESWQRADLAELIRAQFTMTGAGENARVRISGPVIMLSGQLALNLALVFHELASNAMYHGALSEPEGKIDISWTINEDHDPKIVDLTWREMKGPVVRAPTVLGFGSRLIERSLKRGLGAEVDIHWRETGIVINMKLPVPELRQKDYFAP